MQANEAREEVCAQAVPYSNLGAEVLVKIFQLADLLGVTPRAAAKLYLIAMARKGV